MRAVRRYIFWRSDVAKVVYANCPRRHRQVTAGTIFLPQDFVDVLSHDEVRTFNPFAEPTGAVAQRMMAVDDKTNGCSDTWNLKYGYETQGFGENSIEFLSRGERTLNSARVACQELFFSNIQVTFACKFLCKSQVLDAIAT